MSTPPRPSQTRSRFILLLIALMFFAPFGIAAFLRFTGWTPPQSRNVGTLLQPPIDLSGMALKTADGKDYTWRPELNLWRIVVVPDPACTSECSKVLDQLHRLWLTQGRKADRIDVLWFGELPAGDVQFRRLVRMQPDARLAALLPEAARVDAVPAYLVDPGGFVALQYHPGFDPAGMKKDLGKLVK
ncbi:MAG: hypothetical protein NT117_11390 [Gammaproteobacteria bacterium]|nr:hypothetical protein [Gammaproteobacteria bacterium]